MDGGTFPGQKSWRHVSSARFIWGHGAAGADKLPMNGASEADNRAAGVFPLFSWVQLSGQLSRYGQMGWARGPMTTPVGVTRHAAVKVKGRGGLHCQGTSWHNRHSSAILSLVHLVHLVQELTQVRHRLRR